MGTALLALALIAAPADDAAADSTESARRDEVASLAPAKARQVELTVGEKREKATLHPEPLLRWSNPTAGSVYGEVFLWSHQGRPVAIASIYRWYHPYKDSTFEVVSTSTAPLEAREGKELLWRSTDAGIRFEALPGAAEPAETAGGRLNQMRKLSRQFSAQLVDKRSGEAVKRELRLLNQPVYRYESTEQGVVDGALFALVEVTDPEVWVVLEAVKHEDRVVWQYALARMNADACEVRLDDEMIQQWEKIVDPWRYRQGAYTLFGFKPEDVNVAKLAEKPE